MDHKNQQQPQDITIHNQNPACNYHPPQRRTWWERFGVQNIIAVLAIAVAVIMAYTDLEAAIEQNNARITSEVEKQELRDMSICERLAEIQVFNKELLDRVRNNEKNIAVLEEKVDGD